VADTPSAYSYEAPDRADAVDPAGIEAEVQALIDVIREFNAGPAIDAWFTVRAYGGATCPPEVTYDSADNGYVTYFDGQCEASGRYWFKGPMTTYTVTLNTLENTEVYDVRPYLLTETLPWSGQLIKGQSDVYDAQSDLDYNCSCTAALLQAEEATLLHWASYTDGPTHLDGPDRDADAWMNRGTLSNMWMYITEDAVAGRWSAKLDGSVTGHGEDYGDIEMYVELGGERLQDGTLLCDPGTGGEFVVRHSATGIRTSFKLELAAGSCQGCATVAGSPVCIDLSPIVSFEGAPW
jgi:hypothetical protein